MNCQDRALVQKLAIALAIKLSLLVVLWWFFVRDVRVPVDVESAASQMLGASPAPTPIHQE